MCGILATQASLNLDQLGGRTPDGLMREGPKRAIPNWVALLLPNHCERELSDYTAARKSENLAKGRKAFQRKQKLKSLAKCLIG